jgi:predicted CxxxxCH...CXXCH cytochrome family protein
MGLKEVTKIMKTKMKYIFFYSLTTIFSLYLISCSELNTDIPSVPKVNTHGDSIYVPTSANYHPKTIADSPNGMYDCQECHAADFSGGVAGVGCNTADCHPTIGVHVNGIVDPTSENFHGNYIQKNQWDMIPCQSCHGNKYDGGNYKYADGSSLSPTCLDCHTYYGGPENCATCHGSATSMAPPRDLNGNTSISSRGVGAHQVHLAGNQKGKTLSCTDCHNVPGDVYQTSGHIDGDNRAEVIIFSDIAKVTTNDDTAPSVQIDPNQPTYIPSPVYNTADLTCTNSYCHGYFKNGNIDNKPVWNDPSTSQCGSCHGDGSNPLPKTQSQGGNHPGSSNCSICHGGVVDANLKIINPSKHIDGLLNLFGSDIKY